MRARRRVALSGAVACALLLSAAVLEGVATPTLAVGATSSVHVATTTMTFVDTSRSTPPWDGMPATAVPHVGHDHLVSGAGVRIGHDSGRRGPTR